MKVILADDMRGLGHRGDTVTVKPGYARNFLFPQGIAYEATTANVRRLSEEKKKYDEKMLAEKGVAATVAGKVEGLTVVISKKAGEEGHLYGSVTATEIADALSAKGIEVDRRRVELAEPIRRLGTHTVHVRLHRDVAATLNVEVQAANTQAVVGPALSAGWGSAGPAWTTPAARPSSVRRTAAEAPTAASRSPARGRSTPRSAASR